MSAFPDPREERLLNAVAPPPLSAGFADRVMAALPTEAPRPARRDRRGGWKRGRATVIGVVAAGLVSVGAAASGILGDRMQRLPVIATIAEAVTPAASVGKPVPQRVAVKPEPSVSKPAEPVATDVTTDTRREQAAQRIAKRFERREALGLPPVDWRFRRLARARLEQLPPEERRALIERVEAIRAERAASGEALGPPATHAERRARWRQAVEELTPEQREALREWRVRRRAIWIERRARRAE